MKRIRRILLLMIAVIIIVGGGVGYTLFSWTQAPLPQHDGELQLDGLNDTVEILRDEWGVAHIYASNPHDLFFAQGYTHAQDRWWQMEFSRHIGAGRIQELTGANSDLMATDIAIRTMGWYATAEAELANLEDERTRLMLDAFADGVNAYILNRPAGQLAFEYNVLGVTGVNIEIEPWTAADSVVWGKAMAWQLGNDGEELERSALGELLDPESVLYASLYPDYNYDENPTVIMDFDLPISDETLTHTSPDTMGVVGVDDMIAGGVSLLDHPLLTKREGIGSNNWVAGGDITETGSPLLANDMHLGHQMPSIWYEIGLHCQPVTDACPYDVTGFQFPNVPLITAGHNAHIAWGFTDHTDDAIDYFLIDVNPENELQYRWNDGWRDMTVREEVIYFGDSEDATSIQIRETHMGPIINDNRFDDNGILTGFNNDNPRVLRWTGREQGGLIVGLHDLSLSTNWQTFRQALSNWSAPAQHVVYADVEGNIGLQVPGLIPVRAEGHLGTLPIAVTSDAHDWRGFIPYDELPRVYNPERNYIQSANQLTSPPAYFEQLKVNLAESFGEDINVMYQNTWAEGYRGRRIDELLQELAPHSESTFKQILGDNYDRTAEKILPLLADMTFEDAHVNSLRDWLLAWDYQMSANSGEAALYGVFWHTLVATIQQNQLSDADMSLSTYAVVTLTEDADNPWWDDASTEVIETMNDTLQMAFVKAYDRAVELLGEDEMEWRWGMLQQAKFASNPLGLSGIETLEDIVNRSVSIGGCPVCVNAAYTDDDYVAGWGVSERVIYDVSDWDNSLSIHTTGQSGHPYSAHYDSMLSSWSDIEFKPMLWSRDAVEAVRVSQLTLVP